MEARPEDNYLKDKLAKCLKRVPEMARSMETYFRHEDHEKFDTYDYLVEQTEARIRANTTNRNRGQGRTFMRQEHQDAAPAPRQKVTK